MENLAAFSAREQQQRKETSIPLQDSESRSYPASFLKVEGRGTLVGAKDRRERDG